LGAENKLIDENQTNNVAS